MNVILPDRKTAEQNGWNWQVQWIENGNPCFIRCKSGVSADAHADKLKRSGLSPIVVDLRDALQLH